MLAQLLSFLFWTVELCLFLLLWIVCFYCIYVGLHRGLRKYLDSLATTVITGLVIVSLIFEIFYLYQVERAKAMEAYNKGFGCRWNKDSWQEEGLVTYVLERIWHSANQLWSMTDRCQSNFIAVNVNPLWKISPFKVALNLISFLCVTVAEVIGTSVGSFLHSLIERFPLLYQLPVALLVAIVIVFLYVIQRGFKWNWLLFSLSVPPNNHQLTPHNLAGRHETSHIGKDKAIKKVSNSKKVWRP